MEEFSPVDTKKLIPKKPTCSYEQKTPQDFPSGLLWVNNYEFKISETLRFAGDSATLRNTTWPIFLKPMRTSPTLYLKFIFLASGNYYFQLGIYLLCEGLYILLHE